MQLGRIKNWAKFQHYKDRCPPWIKLDKGLLDDFDFARLPIASKALAPLLWLLASEEIDGTVCIDAEWLAFRLRWSTEDVRSGLNPLIERGFVVRASNMLASCSPETETETETETESAASAVPASTILDAYHSVLPNCQTIAVLNPKRRRRIAAAEKLARSVCKSQGWEYDPAEFWPAYFEQCTLDPWLRGEVPNPKNPKWKQNLDVLIREDRFAEIMDTVIAELRADEKKRPSNGDDANLTGESS